MFGMNAEDCVHEDEENSEDDGEGEPKSFTLLNDFSDLLMLPKDMLMDTHVRQEVNLTNEYYYLSFFVLNTISLS